MHASIRTRLLVSLLVIALTTAGALSWYFIRELEGYGLRKLEERLASEAQLVAAVAGTAGMDDPRALGDALHDAALEVNSRLIVLDTEGIAIADSANVPQLGTDYSSRPEIGQALAGEYGAYTRLSPAGRLALYVAYPVTRAGEVTGVAYSSAQTFSILTLLQDYRARLGSFVVLFAAVTLVLAELLARWLSRPLRRLEAGAVAFANGDHDARVTPSGSRETRAVGAAFNTMADEVERVVSELRDEERRKSQFVSDVSHELRSPLTAIR
ncbi:MAG: HAMP domain-containing protein, partial [Actinomycetota bacterium]|nr:HAMP domain-containing protein [Actinomycetota bacterium]